MKCKWLNVILVWIKEYKSKLFQKKYIVDYENNKRYNINEKIKKYDIDINKNKYWVCYCVSYRFVWGERILQRGWWNDEWIWKADWIFNDWIV